MRDYETSTAEVIKEILIQGSTSGTIAGISGLLMSLPEDVQLFYNLGVGLIGATAAVLNSVNLNGKDIVIRAEIEKVQKTISSIQNTMERNNITELKNLFIVNLSHNLYQFIKTIFNEAMEANTETMRDYCASCIVWAGVADFSEGIDFRKLYKCLDILKQLDDLDFTILKLYEFSIQLQKTGDRNINDKLEEVKTSLLTNHSFSVREIDISLKKMNSLGLLPGHSNYYVYENSQTKSEIIDSIGNLVILGESSPMNVTSIYLDFNKYIHTFNRI